MTTNEFAETWQEWEIVLIPKFQSEKHKVIRLKDPFMLCIPVAALTVARGHIPDSGLLFDTGAEMDSGIPGFILNCDEQNNCLQYDPHNRTWEKIGILRRIATT